jgi:hypothetical protein
LLPKKDVEKIVEWSASLNSLEDAMDELEGEKRIFSRSMVRAISQLGLSFKLVPLSGKTNQGMNNFNTTLERILTGGEKYTS